MAESRLFLRLMAPSTEVLYQLPSRQTKPVFHISEGFLYLPQKIKFPQYTYNRTGRGACDFRFNGGDPFDDRRTHALVLPGATIALKRNMPTGCLIKVYTDILLPLLPQTRSVTSCTLNRPSTTCSPMPPARFWRNRIESYDSDPML